MSLEALIEGPVRCSGRRLNVETPVMFDIEGTKESLNF